MRTRSTRLGLFVFVVAALAWPALASAAGRRSPSAPRRSACQQLLGRTRRAKRCKSPRVVTKYTQMVDCGPCGKLVEGLAYERHELRHAHADVRNVHHGRRDNIRPRSV